MPSKIEKAQPSTFMIVLGELTEGGSSALADAAAAAVLVAGPVSLFANSAVCKHHKRRTPAVMRIMRSLGLKGLFRALFGHYPCPRWRKAHNSVACCQT